MTIDSNPDAESFGAFLARMRKNIGLKQGSLASRLGVDVRTIKRWETNKARPTPDNQDRLAEALGLLPNEITKYLADSSSRFNGGAPTSERESEVKGVVPNANNVLTSQAPTLGQAGEVSVTDPDPEGRPRDARPSLKSVRAAAIILAVVLTLSAAVAGFKSLYEPALPSDNIAEGGGGRKGSSPGANDRFSPPTVTPSESISPTPAAAAGLGISGPPRPLATTPPPGRSASVSDRPAPGPAPEPTSSSGVAALTIAVTENPFSCNGQTRQFARLSGAIPGENVQFSSIPPEVIQEGKADASGNDNSMAWQCDIGSSGDVMLQARGSASGRTGSVTFRTVAAGTLDIVAMENPFFCDGGSRPFAKLSGALPHEGLSYVSHPPYPISPGSADPSGNNQLFWQCNSGDDAVVTLTAYGAQSHRVGTITFRTVTP